MQLRIPPALETRLQAETIVVEALLEKFSDTGMRRDCRLRNLIWRYLISPLAGHRFRLTSLAPTSIVITNSSRCCLYRATPTHTPRAPVAPHRLILS